MKWLALLLACALLACGQQSKNAFVPPDGHWWQSATQPQRDGFFVGYWECADFLLRETAPVAIADVQVQEHIGDFYRANREQSQLPITAVIARLYSDWRRTGAYHFERADPKNEWNGDYWRQGVEGERPGFVLGFLSCQAAAGEKVTAAPISRLVSWIDHFYGVDPNDYGVIGARGNEKLSTAILAAERANP